MDSFGQRLKRLREEKKVSQEQLALSLGKSGKAVVSGWERGTSSPTLADLIKLCEVLGTTAAYLVDGESNSAVAPTPPGYVLMPMEEVIEMQRQLLKQKGNEIVRQK